MKVRAEGQLFDIVIRGRGTWAAARSRPVGESFTGKSIEQFRTLAFFSNRQDMNSDVRRIFTGPEAHPTPSCQIANNDEAFRERLRIIT